MSIVFYLERTNQLSLLPDKDLVDLCPPIEPYQVTKNPLKSQLVADKNTEEIICVCCGKGSGHDFSLFKKSRVRFHPLTTSIEDSGYQGIAAYHRGC